MSEKTIQRMRKPELVELIKSTLKDINTLHQAHEKIVNMENALEHGDFLEKIKTMHNESTENFNQIREIHKELFEGDDENKSIESEIERLKSDLEEGNEELVELKYKMLGGSTENDLGEEIVHKGYVDEIKENFEKHNKEYRNFYDKIEKELVSGATTVGMAIDFNRKITGYNRARNFWQFGLISTFLVAIFYFIWWAPPFIPVGLETKQLFFHLLERVPFISFFVWLIIFMGNRRAENQKLAESYKHKEAMAQSYIGYKKSIQELDDNENELLKNHMQNLLDAIKEDSSKFLSSKGESHPALEMAKKTKLKQ